MAKKIDDFEMLKALVFPVIFVPAVVIFAFIEAFKAMAAYTDDVTYVLTVWVRWWRE